MANEIVCAFKNQGKSTLALHLAREKHKPIIAYDEHEVFSDVGDVVADLDELESRLEYVKRDDLLVYIPPGENEKEEFNEFCARIWKPKNCVILIDEASYIQTPGYAPKYLKKLIRLNEERYNVDIIQATHRPTDLSQISRSQSWEWYMLYTPDPRDIEVIRERWGDEVAAAVQGLKWNSHHYIHASATMQTYRIDTDSEKWHEKLVVNQQ